MNRRQALKAGYAMGFMPLVYAAINAPRRHSKKEPEPQIPVAKHEAGDCTSLPPKFSSERTQLAKNGFFSTGFPALDEPGLAEGSLSIILGLPNTGKSAIARTIALSNFPPGGLFNTSDSVGSYDTVSMHYVRGNNGELEDISVKLRTDISFFGDKEESFQSSLAAILHTLRDDCVKNKVAYVVSIPLFRENVHDALSKVDLKGISPTDLAATLISSSGFVDTNRIIQGADYVFILLDGQCHVVKHRTMLPFTFDFKTIGGPGFPVMAVQGKHEKTEECKSSNKSAST